ncbi:MAG TPA: LysR family transcriptional regulator [Candidatus Binatia bacterium]|nr:LysR family transcriptional regulator [Candidatus Binatia bacterium]
MELNLHRLQIFLCVARELSFSKAAATLRISQPSVSIQIKKLQDILGVKLFERLGRRIYLSREGTAVLEHVKKLADIVAGFERDLAAIKGGRRGYVAAGCSRVPSATLVPLAVAEFRKRNPESEIVIKTGRPYEIEQWILANEVDLGVIEGNPASSLIVSEPWYADKLVLVLSRRSRLLKRRQLWLRDVVEEPFLLQAPWGRPTFIERAFSSKGITIKRPVTVGSREAVKAGVAAGYGVALLPRSVIDAEVKAGLLKTKKIADLDINYPMNIVYHRDKQLSASIRNFLQALHRQTSQRRAPAGSAIDVKQNPNVSL